MKNKKFYIGLCLMLILCGLYVTGREKKNLDANGLRNHSWLAVFVINDECKGTYMFDVGIIEGVCKLPLHDQKAVFKEMDRKAKDETWEILSSSEYTREYIKYVPEVKMKISVEITYDVVKDIMRLRAL